VSASASARKAQQARNLPMMACAARNRHGQQQFHRAEAAFFRPQAHADGGNEEQVQPRVPGEEGHQRGFTALEEIADGEGEETGEQQEDHQEHVGDRRGEVARQLAFHDGADIGPSVHACTS